jgi:hypothetical protein
MTKIRFMGAEGISAPFPSCTSHGLRGKRANAGAA